MIKIDRLWTQARIAAMRPGEAPYGAVEHGVIAESGGRIVWIGGAAEAPQFSARETVELDGRWVTPGLIDCHTHIVYGGDRAHEFELRHAGASYEEIARAGGGILSTVRATRAADEDTLFSAARPRVEGLIAEGVTTLEIKSGYGLDAENECKMLRVARRLGAECGVSASTSFLGAHAVPPEVADADAYMDDVIARQLPRVAEAGLADAVDGFCESFAFSRDQMRRLFTAAHAAGLPVKLHAEQLSNLGGAALAAEFGALSADHLEYVDEPGVVAMARAGTAAVLLPGAFYTLGETHKPPIDLLREHGVAMAVATDCNPGSSPLTSLLLAMNMAVILFGLSPEEALAGVTSNAARALGLADEVGTLAPGKRCDLAIWDLERPGELVYRIGANPLHRRIWSGP